MEVDFVLSGVRSIETQELNKKATTVDTFKRLSIGTCCQDLVYRGEA